MNYRDKLLAVSILQQYSLGFTWDAIGWWCGGRGCSHWAIPLVKKLLVGLGIGEEQHAVMRWEGEERGKKEVEFWGRKNLDGGGEDTAVYYMSVKCPDLSIYTLHDIKGVRATI